VDGEVGRITFGCHRVVQDGSVLLDTSRQVYPALTGKQWYRTVGFKELAIVRGALGTSYRQTTQMLNRLRHQPQATPLRTLQDAVEAEGLAAATALDDEDEARNVVRDAGIDAETLAPVQEHRPCSHQHLDSTVVEAALRAVAPDPGTLEAMRTNPVSYEDPQVSVNVSIDDVLAKKQREHRCGKGRSATAEVSQGAAPGSRSADEQKKRVHTTVAHVQNPRGKSHLRHRYRGLNMLVRYGLSDG
jgi:hypothetical protein